MLDPRGTGCVRYGLEGQRPAPAQDNRVPSTGSHGGQCRGAGVAVHASDEPDRHRAEHALHAGSHMVGCWVARKTMTYSLPWPPITCSMAVSSVS
jgi:hypothetical protein